MHRGCFAFLPGDLDVVASAAGSVFVVYGVNCIGCTPIGDCLGDRSHVVSYCVGHVCLFAVIVVGDG